MVPVRHPAGNEHHWLSLSHWQESANGLTDLRQVKNVSDTQLHPDTAKYLLGSVILAVIAVTREHIWLFSHAD